MFYYSNFSKSKFVDSAVCIQVFADLCEAVWAASCSKRLDLPAFIFTLGWSSSCFQVWWKVLARKQSQPTPLDLTWWQSRKHTITIARPNLHRPHSWLHLRKWPKSDLVSSNDPLREKTNFKLFIFLLPLSMNCKVSSISPSVTWSSGSTCLYWLLTDHWPFFIITI